MDEDVCPKCGGTEWLYNLRHGTRFCRGCGTVKESLSDKELEEIERETEQAAKLTPITAPPKGEGWEKLRRARLRRELDEALKQEQLEVEARDVEMKAKGFTHRVTFWDHCTGDDDVQADVYYNVDPKDLKPGDDVWEAWMEIKTASIGDYEIIRL